MYDKSVYDKFLKSIFGFEIVKNVKSISAAEYMHIHVVKSSHTYPKIHLLQMLFLFPTNIFEKSRTMLNVAFKPFATSEKKSFIR